MLRDNFIRSGRNVLVLAKIPSVVAAAISRSTNPVTSHRWFTKPMSPLSKRFCFRLVISEEDSRIVHFMSRLLRNVSSVAVLSTLGIDVRVRKVLPTERANHLVLFQLARVSVHKTCPLVHLVSRLLIEFFLIEVVLLLKLLTQLPDYVILKFKKLSLLLVMLQQDLSLRKLPRQVIRVDINVDFKLFGDCVLYVFVELSVPV